MIYAYTCAISSYSSGGGDIDPLSDILSLVRIKSHWSERFEWGADWCLHFNAQPGIRSYAVLDGECWLSIEGMTDSIKACAGDCVLLPTGRSFRVGSDLNLPAVDAIKLSEATEDDDELAESYAGNSFVGIGGFFTLSGEHAPILTGILPAVLHIRDEADRAVLRWTLERLSAELRESQPGADLVTQQLATMLVVQALRIHLGHSPSDSKANWLFALSDKQIRTAMEAMHSDPGHPWTVEKLGRCAGVSRTTFAMRFKNAVGMAPMEYLTNWRMKLACERLTTSKDSISAISLSLGYESESAFSTAFKRTLGHSPRSHARLSTFAS